MQDLGAMIDDITGCFRLIANKDKSKQMTDYMKGHFDFYGITSPQRKEVFKQFKKAIRDLSIQEVIDLSKALWNEKERELHYFAMDSLDIVKQKLTPDHLSHGEFLITTNSWWDSVDFLATHYFTPILLKLSPVQRESYALFLAEHKDMWMNRVGIIFQLTRKLETETNLLELAIIPHLDSKEFFHQKAIGWALRQYSKYNPLYVKEFVENNPLQKLSIREATKYLSKY